MSGNSLSMNQIQLMPSKQYIEDKYQKSISKVQANFFDYANDLEEHKTRNSTFSKASEGREDI